MKLLSNKLIAVVKNSKEVYLLILINFIILITFVSFYPAIFNWDGVNRLVNHNTIYVSHWLPGLQSVIWLMYKVGLGMLGVRVSLILISLGAAVFLYLFVSKQFGKGTAFISSLLFMTTPRLLAVAIVPYQEMLMFFLIFLGLYFFVIKYEVVGCFFVGASCLVRYEAWIFCFLFAVIQMYLQIKDRNKTPHSKKTFLKPLIILWGIAMILFLKYTSLWDINESDGVNTLLNLSSINIIHLIRMLFERIADPILVFVFAILGMVHCFLFVKDEKQKSLWFAIFLFFLASLFPAALRVDKAAGSFRTTLIPVVTMTLFVPFGVSLTYNMLNKIKTSHVKSKLQLLLISSVCYIVFVNLSTANSHYKANYKYTNFDEYYAASRIAKEHRSQKILIIEPPNFGNFNVTSIYLNDKDDVHIYPSLNYGQTKLNEIFEKNNFTVVLRIGNSQDRINEMIENICNKRITKNGIEIIYLN